MGMVELKVPTSQWFHLAYGPLLTVSIVQEMGNILIPMGVSTLDRSKTGDFTAKELFIFQVEANMMRYGRTALSKKYAIATKRGFGHVSLLGVIQGKYTFKDGLEFSPQDWDYCTDSDRRYYSERVNGFQPGDPQLSNDPAGPPAIPPDTFDCGDGYYDPRDEVVYNYLGQKIRIPDEEEKEWIVSHCRIGRGIQKGRTDVWTSEAIST
ncbi:MORN repeat-containing protein 5 [Gaertneriomyces sp. JEL0708]|nr:MORN repeat-containing protein 5 [Gaertneriomyces sp. JEL0708]